MCILAISGCASMDRQALTRFEPIASEGNARIFKYVAVVPGTYSPEESSSDEKVRIEWLAWHLAKNGFDQKNYEIMRREAFLTGESVLAKSYNIIYTVKVRTIP